MKRYAHKYLFYCLCITKLWLKEKIKRGLFYFHYFIFQNTLYLYCTHGTHTHTHLRMGVTPSRDDYAKALRGIFVVEVVSAQSAPHIHDSNLFCRMRVLASSSYHSLSSGETSGAATAARGEWVRTVARRDTADPVWHSYRDLCTSPNDGDRLELQLCYDKGGGMVETVAANSFPIEAHKRESFVVWLKCEGRYAGFADVSVTLRYVDPPLYTRKVLYFIRHGESRWNEVRIVSGVEEGIKNERSKKYTVDTVHKLL